ncbi:MAG TPA: magnesium and cobalt transport protein CorA [Psychrobacter sp.]|uniref:Magnesium transport protein CorA n=1 Tax=Psychrobacter glacincola TaxID=56810 RepID=A0ABW1W7G6_9GAMM|nr:magnesium/cobalt transporter CorA [Psychrobacter glacincola]HAR75923.1 magnesium and cobalt transport protein CorA [Psychrobacter sp.]
MKQDDDLIVETATRITPESNVSLIDTAVIAEHSYLDNYDSYIYGDSDATVEDSIETMTVYDPDSERYEDIENSSTDEVVSCYSYSRKTGEKLDQVALNDVNRCLSNNGQFIWLGLYDPSLETMIKVQQAFGLHELAIEDAFADHQRAKVENYDNDMVFVVLRTAKLEDNVIRYGTTAIFMGKNYLITIRNGPSNSYAPVREHCNRRPEKLRMGPIFVLHAILDFIVDNYMPITDRLGRYLREQERYVFTYEFDKSTLKNLYELKSQLVHMRAIILPVQDICSFFINHKKSELISGFSQAAKPYFRDVNDHLLHSLDAINGLNEMLSVVMNTYMAMVNMGQNEVVRKLAAWAGILAVPTAIAGIYGMNFDFMPELHWKYAYFVIMAVIITLCSYLYYNFKRLKWL